MDNLIKYFRDTAFELRQVTWPTQQQALVYTSLVIAIAILVAMFVGAFDFLFSQGVSFLVNNL